MLGLNFDPKNEGDTFHQTSVDFHRDYMMLKGKKRVKLSMYLIKHSAKKTYRGVEVQLHHSWPRHKMEVSGQLHAPTALPPSKSPPVPIG
jgi:hypothetical protein